VPFDYDVNKGDKHHLGLEGKYRRGGFEWGLCLRTIKLRGGKRLCRALGMDMRICPVTAGVLVNLVFEGA